MSLPAGEPAAGPWRAAPVCELLDLVLQATGNPPGRPRIVAVDGRGAAGKSTPAARAIRPTRWAAHGLSRNSFA
jgi:hypothetical protein